MTIKQQVIKCPICGSLAKDRSLSIPTLSEMHRVSKCESGHWWTSCADHERIVILGTGQSFPSLVDLSHELKCVCRYHVYHPFLLGTLASNSQGFMHEFIHYLESCGDDWLTWIDEEVMERSDAGQAIGSVIDFCQSLVTFVATNNEGATKPSYTTASKGWLRIPQWVRDYITGVDA